MDSYLFADEAGCFTFNRQPNISRYFIICTVTMLSRDVSVGLFNLRRDLVRKGALLGDYFHATEDRQEARDLVFETMLSYPFKVQATICEKSKAQPHVRDSKAIFYKYPWFYHFKHGIANRLEPESQLLVTAASIGTRKEKTTFRSALDDVMVQAVRRGSWAVDFRPCATDPCLQVADYCAWAVQRKWERGDTRSYDMIASRITYEYELWKNGTVHYY